MDKDDKDKKGEDDKSYLHNNNGSSDVQQNHGSNESTLSEFMT